MLQGLAKFGRERDTLFDTLRGFEQLGERRMREPRRIMRRRALKIERAGPVRSPIRA